MSAPRYQEIKAVEIPEVTEDDGTTARIVCGTFWGKKGPVEGIAADPIYVDVTVPPGKRKKLPVETTRHAFAYVFAGSGKFCNASAPLAVPTQGSRRPLADPLRPRRRSRSAGRRGRHPVPPRLRQAPSGTSRLVRPDCD